MWRRLGFVLKVVTIWGAITAYVVYSAVLAHRHRQEQSVERVAIDVVDSTSSGQLITSQRVKEMLLDKGIATINTNVDRVDTHAIKELICNECFVDDVDIYASYSGTLHIRISQRTPILRLLVDGYNCYITENGYLFQFPAHAALYVPVVTGDYKPLFPRNFEGEMREVIDSIRKECAEEIAAIGKKSNEIIVKRNDWQSYRKAVRDSVASRKERQRYYDNIDGHIRDYNRTLEATAVERDAVLKRLEQKEREHNDFLNLIDLVAKLQSDKFWRAEIVQIVATRGRNRELSLTFIPRSGNHRIHFGWIENVDDKLYRLRQFYDKVAVTSGWDSYKSVDLNYADRVVCTYNKEK